MRPIKNGGLTVKKILAIGNSFSEDATSYLEDIATCGGEDCKVVNLYIGGCSLERHYNNVVGDLREYDPQFKAKPTGEKVSIRDGLISDNWDIVTFQQVSGLSGVPESYHPYLEKLSEYVKEYCPNAKQYLHMTWAYEKNYVSEAYEKYYNSDQERMHECIVSAYGKAKESMGKACSGIIPTGKVIAKIRQSELFDIDRGGISMNRDGFHLSLTYGRYAAAATWYETLFGKSILDNQYVVPHIFDNGFDEKFEYVKKCVNAVCSEEN